MFYVLKDKDECNESFIYIVSGYSIA